MYFARQENNFHVFLEIQSELICRGLLSQLRGVLRFSAKQQPAQHHKGARGSGCGLSHVPQISDDGFPVVNHHLQRAQLPRRLQQQGETSAT